MRRTVAFLALGLVVASAPAQLALRQGDRIAFYGDSITDNSVYTTMVETFLVNRYQGMNFRFFNAGVGGDRVTGGWMGPVDERLTRDLFSRKPTVVTVMLGMNDGGYRPLDSGIRETYEKGYRHIADRLRREAPSARVWLIEPSPFDDVTRAPTFAGGYNETMLRFGEFNRQLAQAHGFKTVDFNAPVVDALKRAHAADPAAAQRIIGDRVHPGTAGHLVMAAALLKGWGADPMVSRVIIDTTTAEGFATKVGDVKRGATWEWTQKDDALPFPIDRKEPSIALLLQTTDLQRQLSQQPLTVRGLEAGNYRLSIDGQAVGTFSSANLASGIDLATLDTPMIQQAAAVHGWTTKRKDLRYTLWRQLEFGLKDANSRERADAIRSLERLENDIIRRQHEAARPKVRRYRLERVA